MALPIIVASAVPVILKGVAITTGAIGLGVGIKSGLGMKKSNDTLKEINERHETNIERVKLQEKNSKITLDKLGKLELDTLAKFKHFSDTLELIQNRPEFEKNYNENIDLPEFEVKELKNISIEATTLLATLSGASLGTIGAIAAAGCVKTVVATLALASTGTPISALSGVAATNAILAVLGGGTLASGGGGIALGAIVLKFISGGVGILACGVIFELKSKQLSKEVDKARLQMLEAEEKCEHISNFYDELERNARKFIQTLEKLNELYNENFEILSDAVNTFGRYDWNKFTGEEKIATENTVLLVGILYKMCNTPILKIKEVPENTDDEEKEKIPTTDDIEIEKIENIIKLSKDIIAKF